MAKHYSIFVLGESQLTISGGVGLDGITQGDGSHLVGHTITLNSHDFDELKIKDGNTRFSDNDGDQKLLGSQEVDGTNYHGNTEIEAEYGLTLTDGTHSWQVVGVNVVNSSTAFATVEALAFVGDPGDWPPAGVPLSVVAAQEGPNFQAADYVIPVCYARGTRIETADGPRPIETLRPGDLVRSLDRGLRPVLWTGGRSMLGVGRAAPVEIAAGTLGATAPLCVSRQHRILVSGADVELLFGSAQVFVPAIHLVAAGLARLGPPRPVSYFHLVLDRHEVIFAEGLASESLLIPPAGADPGEAAFFPELATLGLPGGPAARRCLTRPEAMALLLARARRQAA